MSGTPAQVKAKFALWPKENWYGKCAGVVMTVVNHFGKRNGAPYASAKAAQSASKIISTNPGKAPVGAVHHWDYYGRDYAGRYGNWGHVGVDMFGGGTRVLNATAHADERWGLNVGLSTVRDITNRVGNYKGWSLTYGVHEIHIELPAPAGKPVPPKPATPVPVAPEEEEEPMLTIVVGPKDNPGAAKYIYDQEAGKLTRSVRGAAESAVLRAVEAARPDACVFVEVDAKHIAALKS